MQNHTEELETITFQTSGNVARITMNRPDVRNAFDERMIAEVHQAIKSVSSDDKVRVAIITGAGSAFSAGADISWMRRMGQAGFEENYQDALKLAYMFDSIAKCPKPTIARVNGPTIGGGSGLVAACDIAIGSEKAFFSFSEVKIGLVPACIGPYVIRKVGQARSRELFISGRRIFAAEAEKYGLLNFVAPEGKLDEEVTDLTERLISSGPEAIKAAKDLVTDVPDQTCEEFIDYTARMIAELRTSPEGREGTTAFLEKRKPNWAD